MSSTHVQNARLFRPVLGSGGHSGCTDVFLAGTGVPEQRLAETLARAERYVDAGADGTFVPGVVDSETMAALATAIRVPSNVVVGSGAPSVAEVGRRGVARVSTR